MKCGIVTNSDEFPEINIGPNAMRLNLMTFGRITPLRPVARRANWKIIWLCKCSCGALFTTSASGLLIGDTTSCGCYRTERLIERSTKERNEYVKAANGSLIVTLTDVRSAVVGHTIIDSEDIELLSLRWYLGNHGYAAMSHKRDGCLQRKLLHREVLLAMGCVFDDGDIADHIDGDRLNNRRSNLRVVTRRENTWNQVKSRARSGYKGVKRAGKCSTWNASIQKDKVQYNLGNFATPEDAARAYNSAALRLFGEYAHLNVITSEGAS